MPVVNQTISYILLILIVAGILLPAAILADADDYRYYSRISIENSTGSDKTAPFTFPINAQALADNGWVQDDFEDIKLLSGSTEKYISAMNTSATNAVWRMGWDTVPASSVMNRYLWMGNTSATRNQVWITSATDTMTATPNATLDITTELTVAGSFYITSTPTGTQGLISKAGAYSLETTSSTYTFNIFPSTSATNHQSPNNSGDLTQIIGSVGGAHYLCVDDPPPLGAGADATYIYEDNSIAVWKTDLFQLTSLTVTCGDIEKIEVYFRSKSAAGATPDVRPILTLNSATTTGSTVNPGAAWANYSEELGRPGGGDWTLEDFEDLQAGIQMKRNIGADVPFCSQFYILVYFPNICTETANSVGLWENVRGTYNGATLSLYVDDILQSSATLSVTIATSSNPVVFADFNGYCDDIYIGDTDTETPNKVAEYTFEPLEIDGTTIEDVTSNTNTITYSLASNPANVDIEMDKITPYLLSYYTGEGVSGEDPTGIELDFPDEPDTPFDDADFNIIPGSGFINDQLDGADIPRALFWYTLIILIAIGVGFLAFDKIRDIMATAIATAGALIIGAVTDMGIGYVDILAVAIVMTALYIRRETSTGRL